jgi:NAD(P)-dependent dehydrogenase (short-subunit alcohol dehydrogenase family)
MQKLAIVTGGNTGIGKQTALMLANANHDIVIGCRNTKQGDATAKEIMMRFPEVSVEVRKLDLSDLDSVTMFCQNQAKQWDVLVNNAGAKIETPLKHTKQNYEWHLGVNHLGHFALTADLWCTASTNATVTTVSSVVARKGKLNFEIQDGQFDQAKQYANSKLMNYAFAMMLAKKINGTGRASTAAHPGFARADAYGNKGIRIAEYMLAQSAKSGAKPIFEATSSNNATYVAPGIFELWGNPSEARHHQISSDDIEEFWHISEMLTGRKFLSD